MIDLKNNKIVELINKILDDSSDTIPNDLLRDLIDNLANSQVLCPVKDDEIVLFEWGQKTFIPVFTDLKYFNKTFENESSEIFKFEYLKDFITSNIDGIFINCGGRGFIVNKYLYVLIFNKNRIKKPTFNGYDVKVRLNDYRPITWRDLIIPDNITFMELDDILKTLWDLNGHYLSCFLISKDDLIIIDKELGNEIMMGCDYDASTTFISELFEKYDKITYWYDFGDDWRFDIEIKKKINYTKDYVTIKRFKGKYNPIEDCKGTYGLSEIVYYAENPDERDSSYFCELVEYLEEFDMNYTQLILELKGYTKSMWKNNN